MHTATRLAEQHKEQFTKARHVQAENYDPMASNLRAATDLLERFSAVAEQLQQPGATIRRRTPADPDRISWPHVRSTSIYYTARVTETDRLLAVTLSELLTAED